MPDFSAFLPLISIVIALGAAVGVVIAFIGNKNRGLSQVQESTITSLQATITSLQAQNTVQEKQLQTLEKKVARCEGVLNTIKYTLKERRKLRLDVKDDFVTLIDERTGAEITVPIHPSPEKEEKEATL